MSSARKRACLDAMGIDRWQLDTGRAGAGRLQRRPPEGQSGSPDPQLPTLAGAAPTLHDADETGRAAPSGARIDPTVKPSGDPVPPAIAAPLTLDWDALRAAVVRCQACALHQTRTQTVFGVGDQHARLMVIGEAPGADEDRQGEPFVGRAGQLLTAMLAAIGFARDQVYIANIIKCRPPGNRDPHVEETAACQPFLHRQIALIQPRLILSVGRISAHSLLGTEESVGRLRGRTHRFEPGDIPLLVTYHPAYLLRRPQEKAKAWQDLQAAFRLLSD